MRMLSAFCAVAGLSCAVFAGNIVINPGFETGDKTGWTDLNTNWSVDGLGNSPGPHSGNFLADSGCVGANCITDVTNALSQVVTNTNATYTLSFWYDLGDSTCPACSGPADDPTDTFAELSVLWNGGSIFDVTASNQSDAGYVHFTMSGLLGSVSGVQLSFLGRQDPNNLGIDDVCVVADGGVCTDTNVATPEPTSRLLFMAGLSAIAILGLRRRFLERSV